MYQNLPPHLQASYTADPRLKMAQALQGRAFDTSPAHPIAAMGRALAGYMGGRRQKEVDQDYRKRGEDYKSAMSRALLGLESGDYSAFSDPALGPYGPQFAMQGARGRQARNLYDYQQANKAPVAGRDIPYSPEVQAQRLERAKTAKPETNVTVETGEKGMTELAKAQSKNLIEQWENADGAAKALVHLREAKALLDAGTITGSGAEFLVQFGNFLATRLGFREYEDPVVNTQAFAATMGTQVGQIIKQFGAGTGLSDADREYAEKIVGGKITLNEQAIRKLIEINERAHMNVLNNYNKRAEQVMGRPGAEALPFDMRIQVPDMKPPASSGVPPPPEGFVVQ